MKRNRTYVKIVQDSLAGTAGIYSDIIDRMAIFSKKQYHKQHGAVPPSLLNYIHKPVAAKIFLPWISYAPYFLRLVIFT